MTTADLPLKRTFSWQAPWGKQALRYAFTAHAQWNGTPLTPQERFSIGSRYTVRGFDGEQSLLADRGWYVRNDLGIAHGSYRNVSYELFAGTPLVKPVSFQTVPLTLGFMLNCAY